MSWLLILMADLPLIAGSVSHTLTIDSEKIVMSDILERDGNTYTRLLWSGLYDNDVPGSPELPCVNISFLVPTCSNQFEVYVEPIEVNIQKLTSRLYPVQPLIPMSVKAEDVAFVVPDETLYNELKMAEVIDEQMLAGRYHIVSVRVPIAAYEAVSGDLQIYSEISVGLSYKECDVNEMSVMADLTKCHKLLYPLESIVVNPSDETAMVCNIPQKKVKANVNAKINQYHIIAPDHLCDALENLKLWKSQKGYDVRLISTGDIYKDPRFKVTGALGLEDEAASIRKYLKTCYDSCEGEMFCLLVGSPIMTNMPIRYWPTSSSVNNSECRINTSMYVPTDSYFANVTDLWPLEWNEFNSCFVLKNCSQWLSPEIMVGRLLCTTETEIENYTNKLILYESNPGRGNSDYLSGAFIFEQDSAHGNDSLLGDTNDVYSELSSHFNVVRYQDNVYDSEIWPEGKDVIAKMRLNGYNVWAGHGNPVHVAVSGGIQQPNTGLEDDYKQWRGITALEKYDDKTINAGDVSFLNYYLKQYPGQGLDNLNNADYPSVVYSISCTNAPFDFYSNPDGSRIYNVQYNLASSYTVAGSYGGPVFLGNTREGYKYLSSKMHELFLKGLYDNTCVGIAENYSKIQFNSYHLRHTHNIYGDPELNIWLGKPINPVFSTSGFGISSYQLAGGNFYQFDGHGNTLSSLFGGSASVIPIVSNTFNSGPFLAYGIWKDGFLPVIELRNVGGRVSSGAFNFIVRNAVLGADNNAINIEIDGNTHLDITAIDNISLNSGVLIKGNSMVSCHSQKTSNVEGVYVYDNSSLIIESETTVIEKDFSIAEGAVMNITQKYH